MDLGFRMASPEYQTVWAIDSDRDAVATFGLNFGEGIARLGDIVQLDMRDVPGCDLVIGGFPCQDFSAIGRRQGVGSSRGCLFRHFARCVSAKKPKAFVAENVQGIISANCGEALRAVVGAFEGAGYSVGWKLYDFADYGVPQHRKRVLIVGIRKDLGICFRHPAPAYGPNRQRPWMTAKEALAGAEAAPHNNQRLASSEKVRERLSLIPPGGNIFDIPASHPLSYRQGRGCIYRRLHPDMPSRTVLASGGGGTRGCHYSEPRALTNRELARLQSFPDSFVFAGSISSVRRQIGNAVPPQGIAALAKALLPVFLGSF